MMGEEVIIAVYVGDQIFKRLIDFILGITGTKAYLLAVYLVNALLNSRGQFFHDSFFELSRIGFLYGNDTNCCS